MIGPGDWTAGLAAVRAGDLPTAERAFGALLERDPQWTPQALAGLAASRRLSGEAAACDALIADAIEAAMLLERPAAAAFGLVEAFGGVGDGGDQVICAAALFALGPTDPIPDPFPRRFAAGLAALDRDSDPAAAETALTAALALRPDHDPCRWALFRALCAVENYAAAVALISLDFARRLDPPALISVASRCVRAPLEDEAHLSAILNIWAEQRSPVPQIAPAATDPTGRRLRIGVSQTSFHVPAYYNALVPTLAGLAAQVDLIAYHFGPPQGVAPAPLAPYLALWRDMQGGDAEAAAQQIAADCLDVLLDLEGLSTAAPLEVYRRRPAPVIAATYNILCSLGPKLFDWVIGDAVTLTPGLAEDYAEQAARIASPYYYEAFSLSASAPDPTAPDGPLTLGGFCQLWKISPVCAAAWAAILQARPDTRLLLRTPALRDPAAVARVQALLAAAGAPLDRIDCDGAILPYEDHLRRYARIDVLLDPFPFQGPSTIFEALWQGVPVATRKGRRWVARMGCSMVAAAGFPQWIAEDESDYVRLALDLIDAAPARRTVAARLAQRDRVRTSALCDALGFGQALEAALRAIVEDAWRRR